DLCESAIVVTIHCHQLGQIAPGLVHLTILGHVGHHLGIEHLLPELFVPRLQLIQFLLSLFQSHELAPIAKRKMQNQIPKYLNSKYSAPDLPILRELRVPTSNINGRPRSPVTPARTTFILDRSRPVWSRVLNPDC